MVVHKNLVRTVFGLAIAGSVMLVMGVATPAGAETMTAPTTARGPGSLPHDPALCYRINYKLLCIADPVDDLPDSGGGQEAVGPPHKGV